MTPGGSNVKLTGAGRALLVAVMAAGLGAGNLGCGSSKSSHPADMRLPDGAVGNDLSLTDGAMPPLPDGSAPTGDLANADLAHAPAPPPSCSPLGLADSSKPTATVGTGTAGSCTEAALRSAVIAGGVIVFDCGSGAVTISITSELPVPSPMDTLIDGNNVVTLDGGGKTRILNFTSGDYRGKYGGAQHLLTVQRLTFQNGKAAGTTLFPTASPPCSQGYRDGSGGAILMTNGKLHVIDCTFKNNQAAMLGPDVGGGAVYTAGSVDTTVVGSTFSSNVASNAGAIGSLNSDLTLTNDTFDSNSAAGHGGNDTNGTCPDVGGQRETGSGGNGGAVTIDGGDGTTVNVCGCSFSKNSGHAAGGAFFRTPDGATQATNFILSTFDSNTCVDGTSGEAGAVYLHNSDATIVASTFSNNSAPGSGAIFGDSTTINATNSTFYGNIATTGVGGAIGGPSGTLTNCTFANNQSHGTAYAAFAAALFGGKWVINNSLFDNNIDNDNSGNETCAYFGGTNAGSHDVQWPHGGLDSACVPSISFADPEVGSLSDNGGPTLTAAPAASILQVGTACPSTDQTGRVRKSPCTLGALEAQ